MDPVLELNKAELSIAMSNIIRLPDDCWKLILPYAGYHVYRFERTCNTARQIVLNNLIEVPADWRSKPRPPQSSLLKYCNATEIDTDIKVHMHPETIATWMSLNRPLLKTIRAKIYEDDIENFSSLTEVKNYKNIDITVECLYQQYRFDMAGKTLTIICKGQCVNQHKMLSICKRIVSIYDVSKITHINLRQPSVIGYLDELLSLFPGVYSLSPRFGIMSQMLGRSSAERLITRLALNNQIRKLVLNTGNMPRLSVCPSVTEVHAIASIGHSRLRIDDYFPNLKTLKITADVKVCKEWCPDIRKIYAAHRATIQLSLVFDVPRKLEKGEYVDKNTPKLIKILELLNDVKGTVKINYEFGWERRGIVNVELPAINIQAIKEESTAMVMSILPEGTKLVPKPVRNNYTEVGMALMRLRLALLRGGLQGE